MGLALMPFDICTAHRSLQRALSAPSTCPALCVLSHPLGLLCLCASLKNLGVPWITLKQGPPGNTSARGKPGQGWFSGKTIKLHQSSAVGLVTSYECTVAGGRGGEQGRVEAGLGFSSKRATGGQRTLGKT